MIGDGAGRLPPCTWHEAVPAAFMSYALGRAGTDGLGDPASWDDGEAAFIAEDLAEDLGHAHDSLGLAYGPTAATVAGAMDHCHRKVVAGRSHASVSEDCAVCRWNSGPVMEAMARHGLGLAETRDMLAYAEALCVELGLDGRAAVLAGVSAWASGRSVPVPSRDDCGAAAGAFARAA